MISRFLDVLEPTTTIMTATILGYEATIDLLKSDGTVCFYSFHFDNSPSISYIITSKKRVIAILKDLWVFNQENFGNVWLQDKPHSEEGYIVYEVTQNGFKDWIETVETTELDEEVNTESFTAQIPMQSLVFNAEKILLDSRQ